MSHPEELPPPAGQPVLQRTDIKRLACLVNSAEEIDETTKAKKSFKDLTCRKILYSAVLAGQSVTHKMQEGLIDLTCMNFPAGEMSFGARDAGLVMLGKYGVTLAEFAAHVNDKDIGRNLDVCEICCLGGELVLCDGCPAAAHQSCVNMLEEMANKPYLFCETCKKDLSEMLRRSFSHAGALRLPHLISTRVESALRSQQEQDSKYANSVDGAATVDAVLRIRPATTGFGRCMSLTQAVANERAGGQISTVDMRDLVAKNVKVMVELPTPAGGKRRPTEPYRLDGPAATGFLQLEGLFKTLTEALGSDLQTIGANIRVDPLSWAVAVLDGRVTVLCDVHLTCSPPVAFHDKTEALVGCNSSTLNLPTDWFERHYRADENGASVLPTCLNVVLRVMRKPGHYDTEAVISGVPIILTSNPPRVKRALKDDRLNEALTLILAKGQQNGALNRRWIPRFLGIDKGVLAILVEMDETHVNQRMNECIAAGAEEDQDAEFEMVIDALKQASLTMLPGASSGFVKADDIHPPALKSTGRGRGKRRASDIPAPGSAPLPSDDPLAPAATQHPKRRASAPHAVLEPMADANNFGVNNRSVRVKREVNRGSPAAEESLDEEPRHSELKESTHEEPRHSGLVENVHEEAKHSGLMENVNTLRQGFERRLANATECCRKAQDAKMKSVQESQAGEKTQQMELIAQMQEVALSCMRYSAADGKVAAGAVTMLKSVCEERNKLVLDSEKMRQDNEMLALELQETKGYLEPLHNLISVTPCQGLGGPSTSAPVAAAAAGTKPPAFDMNSKLYELLGMGLALSQSTLPLSSLRTKAYKLRESFSEVVDEKSFRLLPRDLQLSLFYVNTDVKNEVAKLYPSVEATHEGPPRSMSQSSEAASFAALVPSFQGLLAAVLALEKVEPDVGCAL